MLEKISAIEARYNELDHLLEENANDYQKVAEFAKERSDLDAIIAKARLYRQTLQNIEEARALQDSEDNELRQMAVSELQELEPKVATLEKDLKSLMVPKDPRDDRNVIVEIRAGAGGDEAALFAAELMRMYSHYAERKSWKVEILSENAIGIGGYKEVIFTVKGKGAYSRMKYESGVHRVQRVPITESSGRIHTSTVTVAVLAEVDEVEIQIPESDLKIDVFRSSGAGGQNVQKNSTAVRLTHIPTGIVIACQDERSQLQNRLRAMSILRARLYDIEQQKRQQALETTRLSQIGTGERSEKIRTYNFPQSRVTDHRINISNFNIAAVMDGDLDGFIDELSLRDETERLTGESDD
ncbi:MAG: peptide chain release factor 1 [Anaerolineaceae bacterium]|jgi:peptide chain release factor 1